MILIADSGSTKTDWAVLEDGKTLKTIKTGGANPFFLTEEEMAQAVQNDLVPELKALTGQDPKSSGKPAVDQVFFYGAGCTPEKQPVVERVLKSCLTVNGRCEVASDLLAAARALCGHRPGIACILGTGSNSCEYDGTEIVHSVPTLGFILGDEGGGARLGATFLRETLRGHLSQDITEAWQRRYHLTQGDVLDHVYHQKLPNQFLASFIPFIDEHLDDKQVYQMVVDHFNEFAGRILSHYASCHTQPVHFVGSLAFFNREPLEEALRNHGMQLGTLIKAPMEGLIDFHK